MAMIVSNLHVQDTITVFGILVTLTKNSKMPETINPARFWLITALTYFNFRVDKVAVKGQLWKQEIKIGLYHFSGFAHKSGYANLSKQHNSCNCPQKNKNN